MTDGLRYTELRYGSESELQRVGVWQFPDDASAAGQQQPAGSAAKYWFIYIHGGAWRDPRCQLATFVPTIDRIVGPQQPGAVIPRGRVAGFASIDYRLSPHPRFPQDAAHTPAYQLRAARHPDHLADVRAALARLQREYGFGAGEYVLLGHSAGATLAFQVIMAEADGPTLGLPACTVGFEGIYDLPGIVARYPIPLMREIVVGAFGSDEAAWRAPSPALFRRWSSAWTGGRATRLAVLAYSPDDEGVDGAEIDAMERALREDDGDAVRLLVYRDLAGRHDEVREDGRGIARVLAQALAELDRLAVEEQQQQQQSA